MRIAGFVRPVLCVDLLQVIFPDISILAVNDKDIYKVLVLDLRPRASGISTGEQDLHLSENIPGGQDKIPFREEL